jgi:hypothetical protein
MPVAAKIAAGIAAAMIITSLALPGRSTQEASLLKGFTQLSTGTINSAEGR